MHWLFESAPIFPSFLWAACHLRSYAAISLAAYCVTFAFLKVGKSTPNFFVSELYQTGASRFLYAWAARTLALALTVDFLLGRTFAKCCLAIPAQVLGEYNFLFRVARAEIFVSTGLLVSLVVSHEITLVDTACLAAAATYACSQALLAFVHQERANGDKKNKWRQFGRAFIIGTWTLVLGAKIPLAPFVVHLMILFTVIVTDV